MEEKNLLASNICVLRKEARLTIEEFAEACSVSVDTAKAWEEGTTTPYTRELMQICKILKIHEEDILERDIATERMEALKRMKSSNRRNDYNWYLGDKKRIMYYLADIIIVPIIFVVVLLFFKSVNFVETLAQPFLDEGLEVPSYIYLLPYLYALLPAGFLSVILAAIEFFRKIPFRLSYLYLLIFIPLFPGLIILSYLSVIPFYIYCLYQLIFKKGKN